MLRITSKVAGIMMLLTFSTADARAQFVGGGQVIFPGSTPQGGIGRYAPYVRVLRFLRPDILGGDRRRSANIRG